MASVSLTRVIEKMKLENLTPEIDVKHVKITQPDINRPALQLVGFYEYFEPIRLQILGKAEMVFLQGMTTEHRRKVLEDLLRCEIPALIIARNMEVPPELLELAEKHGRTLLRTDRKTVDATSEIIDYLNKKLAPQITRHGVLMNINGQGVLILGESGIGKSETAIELLKRGHRLIADDAVEVRRVSNTTLVGSAPDNIRHYMELRGVGIINVSRLFGVGSVKTTANVNFVIQLEPYDRNKVYDRIGLEEETTDVLGMRVPAATIPVQTGRNLAVIIEVATMNYRQRAMGNNSARELMEHLGLTDDIE